MFKSVPVGLVALTFLSQDVMASKSTYRPKAEQAPWYKTASSSTWNTPDFPMGYKVPSFGVDHEILASQADLSDAEKKLKTKLQVVKKAADPPRDYFVPNFGKDRDVIITGINIDQAQAQHSHTLQASFEKPAGHPVDYFVPNFGADKEIIATQQHISEAEKKLGTKLTANKKAAGHPVDYKVPNFGIDKDIKDTRNSLVSTEKKLGNWNPIKDADGAFVVPES